MKSQKEVYNYRFSEEAVQIKESLISIMKLVYCVEITQLEEELMFVSGHDHTEEAKQILMEELRKYIKTEKISTYKGAVIEATISLPLIKDEEIKNLESEIYIHQKRIRELTTAYSDLLSYVETPWYKKMFVRKKWANLK